MWMKSLGNSGDPPAERSRPFVYSEERVSVGDWRTLKQTSFQEARVSGLQRAHQSSAMPSHYRCHRSLEASSCVLPVRPFTRAKLPKYVLQDCELRQSHATSVRSYQVSFYVFGLEET